MLSTEVKQEIIDSLKNCQFRFLCDKYFSEDFWWIIRGTSKFSGEYRDKYEFFNNVISRLNAFIAPGWEMHILETYHDPIKNTFIVEMKGDAKTKMGGTYNNEYCWIFQFDSLSKKVIKLTAYYDSLLVNQTLDQASAL